jgi:hypothetical protein
VQLSAHFNFKLISRKAGVSKLDSSLHCSTEFFSTITLYGHHGKYCLLFSHIVLGVFTAPLHSNDSGADHVENILLLSCVYRGHVFTESLPSNCSILHNVLNNQVFVVPRPKRAKFISKVNSGVRNLLQISELYTLF